MDVIRRIPVIVAAGKGCRMGGAVKKQYQAVDNIPVLAMTLMVFDRHNLLDDIILVVPGEDQNFCRKMIVQPYAFSKKIHVVAGEKTRQESVFNGIKKAEQITDAPDSTLVLIHDGVRPFISFDLISRLMAIALQQGACIPVLAVNDTLKLVGRNQQVRKTVDRDQIYRAQTPQVFRLDLVLQAFAYAGSTSFSGTDDASVMEHAGFSVYTTPGEAANIKLTTPDDMALAHYFTEKMHLCVK